MNNGIKRKTKPIYITTSEGIEVNSSILSEADETNNAIIVNIIGRSLDCHLLIIINYKNYGKNNRSIQQNNFIISFPSVTIF
mgnify:FL=1|tara:strand:+ start:416 stop:661 length:246 start_codon:yes stop_codon:yes gene_type:complete